ncbi:hypothetical protein P3W66_14355 [Achromobacter denitrificans]|uniref:hypothetical protein n=1 Tax=Achromobacter denitrificans TaxID=32002 RepID=UPI0023E7C8BB|nr:hypothetical protein [Achromobacter denitrificans]MDF3941222.1 hypothetical protein [Achromobacter denitrificans]
MSTASVPGADDAAGIAPDVPNVEDAPLARAFDAGRDGALCVNAPDADTAAAASTCVEAAEDIEKSPPMALPAATPGAAAPAWEAMDGSAAAVGKLPFAVEAREASCPASLAADAVAPSRLPAPAASDATNAAFGGALGRAVASSLLDSFCVLPACESWGGSAGRAAPSKTRLPEDGEEAAVECAARPAANDPSAVCAASVDPDRGWCATGVAWACSLVPPDAGLVEGAAVPDAALPCSSAR